MQLNDHPPGIAIGVHGRFHAFDLASALHPIAGVRQVATTYPAFAARRFLPADIPLRTAPALEILRRLHGRLGTGPSPHALISRLFGRFAARTLPDDYDVFVGWSSASLEAIEATKKTGRLAVVERGSSHILHQEEALRRAYAAHGIAFTGIDPEIVTRELAEYGCADRIAVPTRFAAETFVARGIAAERLLVNAYGVDGTAFARPGDRPARARPVVLFVGGVGIRKGAPELVAAFAPLRSRADLVFVGPLERGWSPTPEDGVRFAGPRDRAGVIAALHDADVFCLPSHEEGLPLSLLQAMAAGLPVVATPETGIADVVTHGTEGFIVADGDRAGLADALATLTGDRDRRMSMGRAAERRAAGLTWAAHGRRALDGYLAALGRPGVSEE